MLERFCPDAGIKVGIYTILGMLHVDVDCTLTADTT